MEEGRALTKKVIAYRSCPTPDTQRDYYTKLFAIEKRMASEGIDLMVNPSMSVETLSWCRGVSLCIPVEVRDEVELNALAMLARRLLKGKTSLADEFPEYQYGREDWLSETELRNQTDNK